MHQDSSHMHAADSYTHGDRNKMAAILQVTCSNLFFVKKLCLIQISLSFVDKPRGPMSNEIALVQVMACCWTGNKQSFEAMMAWLTDIIIKPMCVASLTLIFTRSVGTLQPTRPLGRVGSKFNWPSEDQCQRSHSRLVFVFIPHLKSRYSLLIVSKLPRKSAICPQRSTWRLIVLVRSLRSARLDTAWLIKSMTYFNLIG